MTKILVYQNKNTRGLCRIFLPKTFLKALQHSLGLITPSLSHFGTFFVFSIKRILEMKERKVQTLFVEGKPEPALASALLQARDRAECCHQIEDN